MGGGGEAPLADMGTNPGLYLKTRWKKMDLLMAENITKIIKTAKWGKSHQKNIFF